MTLLPGKQKKHKHERLKNLLYKLLVHYFKNCMSPTAASINSSLLKLGIKLFGFYLAPWLGKNQCPMVILMLPIMKLEKIKIKIKLRTLRGSV